MSDPTTQLRKQLEAQRERLDVLVDDLAQARREAREAVPLTLNIFLCALFGLGDLLLVVSLAAGGSFETMFEEAGLQLPALTSLVLGFRSLSMALALLALPAVILLSVRFCRKLGWLLALSVLTGGGVARPGGHRL